MTTLAYTRLSATSQTLRRIARVMKGWFHVEAKTQYLYRKYTISLEMQNGIAGGSPATTGLAAAHATRFSNEVSNALKLSKKQEGEVSEEAIQAYMLSCSSVFPLDDGGIYVRGYQFNAMIKDAAQRMKATLKHKGLGNTIRDGGLLFPAKVYLGVKPTIIEKPVKPDNGPANIRIFQVAEGVKLVVPCAILDNGDLSDELFRQIWTVAQYVGLGANRHLGYGQFTVSKIDQSDDEEVTTTPGRIVPDEVHPPAEPVTAKAKR